MSRHKSLHLMVSLALFACNGEPSKGTEDPSTTSGPGTSTTSEPDSTSSTSSDDVPTTGDPDTTGEPLPACVEDDFIAEPFAGPGYHPEMGLQGPPQDTYLVSSTVLAPRPEKMQEFFDTAGAMVPVLLANPGLVGFSLGTSAKCGTARTLAVWRDQEAMMAFVVSPEHAAAVSAASELSSTGTITSWQVTAAEIPVDWDTAREKLAGVAPSY
jgi:quinol monooxygenase YgiN